MRILIAIPLLIILVAFALSNQEAVRIGLWPTDILVDVPLSVAVLVAAGIFFVVGAMMTWANALALGARARRAERDVRQLRAQVESLRAQQATMVASQSSAVALLPPG